MSPSGTDTDAVTAAADGASANVEPRDDERGDRDAPSDDGLRVRGVIETTLCCADLEAAEIFYTEVLNFDVFAKEEGRHLFFRCGNGMFLLFDPSHTSVQVTTVGDATMPLHGTSGAGHVAFRADAAEIDAWRRRLEAHGVEIESEVRWPDGGLSIFFRDPAGNCLEFTTPVTWGLDDDARG